VGNLMVGQRIRAGKRQLDTSNLFKFPFGLHAAQKLVPRWARWTGTRRYEVEPTLLPEYDGSRSSAACSNA
jgi:hypothetical protein